LPATERADVVAEAASALERLATPAEGHTALYSLLSQKGDLCLVHWRPDLGALRVAELALSRTRLRTFLVPTYSYLAVIELGTYELMGHAAGLVKKRGIEPSSAEFDGAVKAEMEKMARPRLYPEVPARRYLCFYPMDRKRGESKNWYQESMADRKRMMEEHGLIGRRYAGDVRQIITGSIGFDDWEWGVDLFAEDPLVFKKLIYEMRFDEVSAVYALFGSFYVGLRVPAAEIASIL